MELKNQRKNAFYNELNKGKKALKNNQFFKAFYCFENAHVLGQSHLYRHTLSHYWLLKWGIKSKSVKEILGQFIRIIASLLLTLIWVPSGNTGGSNISAIKKIPIRKELRKYFQIILHLFLNFIVY